MTTSPLPCDWYMFDNFCLSVGTSFLSVATRGKSTIFVTLAAGAVLASWNSTTIATKMTWTHHSEASTRLFRKIASWMTKTTQQMDWPNGQNHFLASHGKTSINDQKINSYHCSMDSWSWPKPVFRIGHVGIQNHSSHVATSSSHSCPTSGYNEMSHHQRRPTDGELM